MAQGLVESETVIRRDCVVEDKSSAVLEEKIAYIFSDKALLDEALTHKSFSNEQADRVTPYNERLEFLGDAVLSLVVSHYMYRTFPQLPEGEMTRIRAEVVSEKGLEVVARAMDLGRFLRLGRGEERTGGRQKSSLVANAMEALLGAVFCDGGFGSVRPVVEALFVDHIHRSARCKAGVDYKTRLQECLQAQFGEMPGYDLAQVDGPPHKRRYTVHACFRGETVGRGEGRSKKAAEQAAARVALERFDS
jgi:ribonuclease-3